MPSCVFGPQATRASGENFHRRQGLLPTDMVFSPAIARGCTSSLGSWTQWFSLPFPITSAGMTRGSDVRGTRDLIVRRRSTDRGAPAVSGSPRTGRPHSVECPSLPISTRALCGSRRRSESERVSTADRRCLRRQHIEDR